MPKQKGGKCPQSAIPLMSGNKLLCREGLSWITRGNSKYERFTLIFCMMNLAGGNGGEMKGGLLSVLVRGPVF